MTSDIKRKVMDDLGILIIYHIIIYMLNCLYVSKQTFIYRYLFCDSFKN